MTMKVLKYVSISKEVEIDFDSEDISMVLGGLAINDTRSLMYLLNQVAITLKAVSDDVIAGMSGMNRKIVKNFLEEQAVRYDDR